MKKILIIHTAFIGDIVLSTPLIRKIKENYKESEITYVTTPLGAAILKNNPDLDEIISYDKRGTHKGIKGLFLLAKRLKYKGFDEVIVLHRYLRSQVLGWLTGASKRIGYDNASGKIFLSKKIHYDKSKHEVEKILEFVDGDISNDKLRLYPGNYEKNNIDKVWQEFALENKKVLVIAPGSKWNTKRWPTKYFNELIKMIKDKVKIIIIGGKDELELNIDCKDLIDMRGKTSLLEVAEICKRSDIVLTNDSSPIHIASAFEKPYIFAIFGATVKELGFSPWSKKSEILEMKDLYCRPCGLHGGDKCPEGHFKCMLDLKPEIVKDKILKKLGEIE